MSETQPTTTLQWPASRFYWARIDGLGWSKSGPLPAGLVATLAEEFPVPIESLHAVGAPTDDGQLLVCACARETIEQIDSGLIELKPAALPPGMMLDGACDHLNMLVGEFEPAPIRTARRNRHLLLATTSLLCIAAVSIGLVRRSGAAQSNAAESAKAASVLVLDFTQDRRDEGMGQQLQAMRTIVDVSKRVKTATDAAAGFEALLKSWPTQVACKPQSVTVSSDGISFGVVIEGDPAPFLKAFTPPTGFALDEPRVTSVGPVTRLTLHLGPRPAGGSAP